MSKKNKQNQATPDGSENSYTMHEKEAADNLDKKKKPILERLGLIEPIAKAAKTDEFDSIELEISTTLDSRATSNNEQMDVVEREEKHNCEKSSIDDIYGRFGINSKENNTIYLIENFIKALPVNLPADVKRQSIINLISVSQVDIICLLQDGSQRLELLKKYYEDFSNTVDDIILSNEKQIKKLNERIAYHNKIISEKQNMKEEQKALIEFEMQKLSNIIEFIENKAR